tara:strand:+ start:12981 stop:13601 length:621 start_codon:yes stop_codon:yes gene_type:complete
MEVVADNVLSQETGPYNEKDLEVLGQEQQEAQEQQDEDLIGGKFKSADDLLKAYQELEKKLGSGQTEETEESESEVEDQEPVVLSQEEETTILESIGGQENFNAVQTWAKENLDQAELEAYNREVNSGDYYRARNALQSLSYAYQENEGSEPQLLGGKISSDATDVFRSTGEVMQAMNDPRYLKDSAYTNDVQEKLIRSEVLGPKG